jgi:AhpD family alkylhydroperoxidase
MQRLDFEQIAPEGMKVLGSVHAYVARSGLPRALIDLVYLRASIINGCSHCTGLHSRNLLKSGMSVTKLALVPVWRESGEHFSEQEKAALGWTEALTSVAQTHAPGSDYKAVAAQFSDQELVDLTIAIGLMNSYNRISIGFRQSPRLPKPIVEPQIHTRDIKIRKDKRELVPT